MQLHVTPEIADQLLASNVRNRPLSISKVKEYAGQMRNGDWKYNGESIKISSDGIILDGQHRLQAVIMSKSPIVSEIIYNLPSDSFDTIDVGKQRSGGDIFAINGVQYANRTAALVNPLYALMSWLFLCVSG